MSNIGKSFLSGLVSGANTGISKRQEEEQQLSKIMQNIYLQAAVKQQLKDPNIEALNAIKLAQAQKDYDTPKEWKPTTKQEYLEAIAARTGKGQNVIGQDTEGNPIYSDAKPLSPAMQKLKAQDTANILSMFETNKTKSALIDEAFNVIDKIPQGGIGSLQIKGMDIIGKNPQLEDIQKVKMVLTDAQLLNTAKTKGAISDREMALFQDAAANNNFSAPRIRPVLKKLKDFMKADETAAREAYIRNYGEDIAPSNKKVIGDFVSGEKPKIFKSESEAIAANLPKGTPIIINGRQAIWE
jgi:hypothetical protein